MITIFVSFAEEDAIYREKINFELEAKGYNTWREAKSLDIQAILYPPSIENAILKSTTVLVIWSRNAKQSKLLEGELIFAQQLKKSLLFATLDDTPLPSNIAISAIIPFQVVDADVITQILQHLPSPQSIDPLIQVSQEAAHEYIQVRKDAIDHCVEMLQRGEQSVAVLAILEYLANKDTMMGIREKAQNALDTEEKRKSFPLPSNQSHDILSVICPNRHTTYFDKRSVCGSDRTVFRLDKNKNARTSLDELELSCGQCGVKMIVYVDCKGYR